MAQIKDIILRLPDKTVAVDSLKIKDLKTIQFTRLIMESNEEGFNNWFYDMLENLYPDLTPYEREFVFIHAYNRGFGVTTHSGITECPKCMGNASISLKIKPAPLLKNFEAIIRDPSTNKPYIKLILELPYAPGEMIKNPEYFYILNEEYSPDEFQEYEITPCSTDIVIDKTGNKYNWSAFVADCEIEKLIRPEQGPIKISELSDEDKLMVKEYLYNFQTLERIREKSNSPINSLLEIECGCGYKYRENIGRALDIVKTSMSAEPNGFYTSMMLQSLVFTEQGYLSLDEIDNMTRADFATATGAIKKIKEAQK